MKPFFDDEPQPEFFDYKHVGGRFLGLVGMAVVAFAVVLAGAFFNTQQFAFSYLFAYAFFLTICMGGLFWTLVHHAVDAEWSVVVRRQLENIASLFVVMAVLFIPLLAVGPPLWKWMEPANAHDPLLLEKAAYLNKPFFYARAIIYFVFFVVSSSFLRAFLHRARQRWRCRLHRFQSPRGLFERHPLCYLPHLCRGGLADGPRLPLVFDNVGRVYLCGRGPEFALRARVDRHRIEVGGLPAEVVTLEHYHIIGKLMLAFTIFWAYIAFSQYMLIWYSNIPEETVYFLRRNTASWWYLSQFLVVGHFFVPFLLLLFQWGKKSPSFLCGMAIWILLMHLLDIYVVVLPALHITGVRPNLLDFFSLLAIGCTLAAVFLKRLGESPLYPVRDPRLALSIGLKN